MLSGSVAFSSECSVHEPAHRAGRRMDAVAEAEEPVTPTAFGLDLIIVADAQGGFALDAAVAPPFPMERLGTIALRPPVALAAPDVHAGGIPGEARADVARFVTGQHPRRAGRGSGPDGAPGSVPV